MCFEENKMRLACNRPRAKQTDRTVYFVYEWEWGRAHKKTIYEYNFSVYMGKIKDAKENGKGENNDKEGRFLFKWYLWTSVLNDKAMTHVFEFYEVRKSQNSEFLRSESCH